MRLSENTLDYLAGRAYSNGLQVAFEYSGTDRRYRSRSDILAEMSAGKDIIHIGCVDHDIPSIERKIKRNKWLHAILCSTANRCYGVDIQEAGIDYLRSRLGYTDVAALDILTQANDVLDGQHWDYVFAPEVLEHTDDPLGFLTGLRQRFSGNAGELVITVPNAFARENHRNAGRGIEVINSDHRFWFTPYTLAKLAVLAGLRVNDIIMCRHGRVKRRSVLKNTYFRKHPLLRSDIVAVLSF